MEGQIDLMAIKDVKELKVLKADEYDKLERASEQVAVSKNNIQGINLRIYELEKKPEKKGS